VNKPLSPEQAETAEFAAPPDAPAVMSTTKTSLIGAVLIALGPVSMALYTPAMPTLVTAFGTSIATIKLTLTLYFAGFALAQLACGPLSDAFGRRPVTLAFMGLYLFASVIALVSPSVETLLIARFLQGIGAAAGVAIARAIVRDLFTGQAAAQIMNTMGIMLALGPALSPTIGGITLDLVGWHAIFGLMVVYGCVVVGLVLFSLPETNRAPDMRLVHPAGLIRAYGQLLRDRRFVLPGIILGASLGGFYALGTMLPFVLIDRAGLTPTQFGLGMLAQSLSFMVGGLTTRKLLLRIEASRLVLPGLCGALLATGLLCVFVNLAPPTYLTVMGPIALYAFSLAFVMPSPSTSALAPFPHLAGAAAAMLGFMQMGGGLLGSLAAAGFGDPVVAIAVVLPTMAVISLGAGLAALKPVQAPESRRPRRGP
jgi:DHA1 family bicyclomycin/chloramphenicol resistance-like MFS transporter